MPLNFNVDPYYDDFDPTKNYHRILFKPGFAVQARELTQAQTILQDQITKFADNIFKQNSPVTGGQVTTNFNAYYIKLQETYNNSTIDVADWAGKLIQSADGTVLAKVVAVAQPTGTSGTGDPPTLIVIYRSGEHFGDDEIIYDNGSNLEARTITNDSTGLSSIASIAQGVFYISGNYARSDGITISAGTFVQVNPQTIIVDKYDNTPSKRIGLNITETIQDYVGDTSLLDPAIGASNYQAPGADRYLITLTLESRPLTFGDDDGFIELVRCVDGDVTKLVSDSVYNVIDDYFAKRDFETNGDYVVNDFKLTPKTNANTDLYTLNVGKGLAYVHGYRIENLAGIDIESNRARTTKSENNNEVFFDYGSYFYVDTVRGSGASFFDTTTYGPIDLHCVTSANVNYSTIAAYNATVVASANIRGLIYDSSSNNSDANTFVYKAYVTNLQNSTQSNNAISGTTNTITLPSYFSSVNDAYVGVGISITSGTSAGDFRTITAYNGSTKAATVNQNWTVVPTSSSVFVLNFDTKDIESVLTVVKTTSASLRASAKINVSQGKVGSISTGDTILQNPTIPELVFTVGNPYVSTITDTSYTTQQEWRDQSFTPGAGTYSTSLTYTDTPTIVKHIGTPGSTLSSDLVKQNFTIIVTDKLTSSLNVGDNIPWSSLGGTVSLDATGKIATLSIPEAATGSGPFKATIISKVFVSNASDLTGKILKSKYLIQGNTSSLSTSNTQVATYTYVDDNYLTSKGQVYIQKTGLVSPGNKQSLYLSDVKQIVKIIDTGSSATLPTVAMLSNASYDVTYKYNFDNGQRDGYYDHASITLKPGYSQAGGNLLICLDYYQHKRGDGYFSVESYINEDYQEIPKFTSSHGRSYSLKDCIDFRPSRVNATTSFEFLYTTSASNKGTYLPVDLTSFINDYSFYLGRKDKLILSKDRSFKLIEGTPAINPIFPAEPDGSLVIANLTHTPYTGYIPTESPTGTMSDLSIEKVKHKRYTMQDIAGLEGRINQVEYYTSLSLLEQKASALQISDSYGLNRFKNGILVDDFSSYATADTLNLDYNATINRREKVMTATQNVKNFPLKSLALAYNMNLPSTDTSTSLGYSVKSDGFVNYFSLPYTTANVVTQKFASRTVNVNPFSFYTKEGTLSLSPNVDNWVDTNYAPSLLIVDPNLQIFQSNAGKINVLSAGDWQTVSGTVSQSWSGGRNWNTLRTTVTTNQSQTDILGPYDRIDNTYALNNGYITDISILPYIRPQQVVVRSTGMLINTTVTAQFDNTSVTNYIRKTNIIELTSVNGQFKQDDVVGYYSTGTFTPTGRIVGVYTYSNGNVRLYVAADGTTTTYNSGLTLQNGFYNTAGVYQTTTASGTISSTQHYGGRIINAESSTKIRISPLSLGSTNYSAYAESTLYINAGTGKGQSATISSYVSANQTLILASAITAASGDVYSIGSFKTNESGDFYGIFNIPENTFHTGERVLTLSNDVNGNLDSATTYAKGTYYAQGLQTTQQQVDFGASPAGAKGTFTSTQYRTTTQTFSQTWSWDPVAQTFMVSKDNYPNGIFLNSIKVFFRTKPTSDNSPITLSIVGTLNGYPNGETLDNSIVTLTPDKVKAGTTYTENPQYLDTNSYTEFTFSAPVYVQPGVLYAFILKSSSNEYLLWTASNGDTALSSSVKNLPSDQPPSIVTKIGGAPSVGALFISQNAQTWTADQNQSLMFVIDRCIFNTSVNPQIQYIIPKKLPQRTLIDQSIDYFLNANSVSSSIDSITNDNISVGAFNVTTTDFTPTTTGISYSYNATLQSGSASGSVGISPGKFGTSSVENLYLNDGNGERLLIANTTSSFSVYAQLSSGDSAVSPIISDAGLSAYAITWNINNCELSNSLVTIVSGGTGYSNNTSGNTTVTISAPTGSGAVQAQAVANVTGGVIDSIYFTNVGSGYITTPTISISDANTTPGTGASIRINGETSKSGGPALAKYVTKKVVLDAGFDSGDLNVYITAYRPVGSDILVYYKILNRNDTQQFDDGSWQLMTAINSSATTYSQTRNDRREFIFAPGTNNVSQGYVSYTSTNNSQSYTTFSQFAIKIVLTTTDKTSVPVLDDLRAIALPPNVNTTF